MTSWVVADSGVYLAIALQEPFAPQAQRLVNTWIQQNYRIATPYLFRYEIISVIRKHISSGKLALPDGESIVQGLLRQPVKTFVYYNAHSHWQININSQRLTMPNI